MKARMWLGSGLAVLLATGVGLAQTQVTSGMRQGMMRSDSTVVMMRGGMSQGMMMRRGGQMGMKGAGRGNMMGGMGMMGGGMGMMGGMMMEPLHPYVRALMHPSNWFANLNLSDQQVAKLEDLWAGFSKRSADVQADIQRTRVDLDVQLSKSSSPNRVKQLLEKYYASKVALGVDAYRTVEQIRSLLTPEQRSVLDRNLKTGSCPGCMARWSGRGNRMWMW